MKNKTLVILAAGMGSRYGGLKQIESISSGGEFIIDFSIYDAVRCGFNKIVFIIREENYQIFLDTIGSRIENKLKKKNIKIEYVFQNFNNVPKKYNIPIERIKPLGTAHALLCSKDVVNEPFVVINADDFYGYDTFKLVSEYLDNNKKNDPGLVVCDVSNNLTSFGSVKRGVCNVKNGKLLDIVESRVEEKNDIITATPLNGNDPFTIQEDTKVSMGMMALYPSFIKYIEENFINFLEKADLINNEYFLPDVLSKGIENNVYEVNIISTTGKWVGITYKEDKESVIKYILYLIEEGKYPINLWS